MAKGLSKVIYKPDPQSTDEYIVIVNSEQFNKWKAGDTTIPLVDVVETFDVFHSGQGSQGILGKASKQTLETVFGSSKDFDTVTQVLQKGTLQAGDGIRDHFSSKNDSKGGYAVGR